MKAPEEPAPGTAEVPPARSLGDPGWHSRGYLPHYDRPGLIQMITFRLADALPAAVLLQLRQEAKGRGSATWRQRQEELLDAGYGACYLREARVARVVESALLYFDRIRYRLLAWVVMPNHLHVLIETLPGPTITQVVYSWKSLTAREVNKLFSLTGQFWQRDYFDRVIRDERHFANAVKYIHNNPVKARLVQLTEDWPYSSASRWKRAGGTPAVPGNVPADIISGARQGGDV